MPASSAVWLVAEFCLTARDMDRGPEQPADGRRHFPFQESWQGRLRSAAAEVVGAANLVAFPNHFPDGKLGSERKCLEFRTRRRDCRLLFTKLPMSGCRARPPICNTCIDVLFRLVIWSADRLMTEIRAAD